LVNPKASVIEPPMASQARKEMAPSAVLPTRKDDQRRALSAVNRRA
jgi:hypothetical protein